MQNLYHFLSILFVSMVLYACTNGPLLSENPYSQDSEWLSNELKAIGNEEDIHDFFQLGLFNLAFEVIRINEKNYSQEDFLSFANHLIDYSEFDKGREFLAMVTRPELKFEVLKLRMYDALKKQDVRESAIYLDSLESISHDYDSLMNVQFMILKAHHFHNTKDYSKAIELYLKGISEIKRLNLSDDLLIQAYRRLGNSYNDIVRDKIPFPLAKEYCYKQGLHYYALELDLLKKAESLDYNRIALNYFTTAMLIRSQSKDWNETVPIYNATLDALIVHNQDGIILTRNPVSTSIALTQLAFIYFHLHEFNKMDSIIHLNDELLALRSLYRVNNKQSLDLLEYYPQRSKEVLMKLNYLPDPSISPSFQSLLYSNSVKYSNQYLFDKINQNFNENSELAISNWVLLVELKAYANALGKNELLNRTSKILNHYQASMRKILRSSTIQTGKLTERGLIDYCSKNQTTILDYQVLHDSTIQIIQIDKHGLNRLNSGPEIFLRIKDISKLYSSIELNDIVGYEQVANKIYRLLHLDQLNTSSVIICPDEYLERIPFDALVDSSKKAKTWGDLSYLADKHTIALIPNLSSIVAESYPKPLNLEIWFSQKDNQTLPYNLKLIDYLKDEYKVSFNESGGQNVLHIMAHTHREEKNSIAFYLDKDTLTIHSNGKYRPSLVVLHGCSSGSGQVLKNEGVISLNRNFIYHGTSSVIFSYWDVDNHSSTELFKAFYMYLREGNHVSEALHKAKIAIRNEKRYPEWSNPNHWAGFQLIGKDISFIQEK